MTTDDTRSARRSALLEAAAIADKLHNINITQQRDVSPEDLAWYRTEPQASLRRVLAYSVVSPLPGIRDWLRAMAEEQQ